MGLVIVGALNNSQHPVKLLVDTNVWLDYFLARNGGHSYAADLITEAFENEKVLLYVTSLSMKDVAYQLSSCMKADVRNAGVNVTETISAAARETAWGCVRCIMNNAVIVPIGSHEVLQACTYKQIHDDFEDDLILGAANSIDADGIVTNDKQLTKHSPIVCVSSKEAVEFVRAVTHGYIRDKLDLKAWKSTKAD